MVSLTTAATLLGAYLLGSIPFGIILTRMSLRSIAYGIQQHPQDPNDLVMFAPLLEQLLRNI